jgi:hypothetical protein
VSVAIGSNCEQPAPQSRSYISYSMLRPAKETSAVTTIVLISITFSRRKMRFRLLTIR